MYRVKEQVLVKRTKWDVTSQRYHESWLPSVIVANLGKIQMRTGIVRFEELVAYNVQVEGTIERVSERNLKRR